jgi:hypothetical protein
VVARISVSRFSGPSVRRAPPRARTRGAAPAEGCRRCRFRSALRSTLGRQPASRTLRQTAGHAEETRGPSSGRTWPTCAWADARDFLGSRGPVLLRLEPHWIHGWFRQRRVAHEGRRPAAHLVEVAAAADPVTRPRPSSPRPWARQRAATERVPTADVRAYGRSRWDTAHVRRSSTSAVWSLAARDLTAERWKQRCAVFQRVSDTIVSDVTRSARDGTILRRGDAELEHEERFTRLVAFGQYADTRPLQSEHLANAGLFGTSAAIDSLAVAVDSPAVRSDLRTLSQKLLFEAWNFVDLAVTILAQTPGTKYHWQIRTTLRACHVLRAAAAVGPVLARLNLEPDLVPPSDTRQQAALDDFDRSVAPVVTACVRTIRNASPSHQVVMSEGSDVPAWVWRFGDEDAGQDTGVVRDINQAVYITASVLVAVVRAVNGGVMSGSVASDLFSTAQRDWLVEMSMGPPATQLDPRFRLFILWALSHLDSATQLNPLSLRVGEADRRYALPPDLKLGSGFDEDHFKSHVGATLGEVVEDRLLLTEVQSDYRLTVGEYRRDYFAVPVVPAALMLAARYHPRWLFRESMGRVLAGATDAAHGSRIFPYQLPATDNGVVYCSYLLGGVCAVDGSLASLEIRERIGHWLPARTVQDHPGGVVVALFVLILAGPVALLAVKGHDTAVGVWIGAMLGLAFAVLVEPLNRLIWGDREA